MPIPDAAAAPRVLIVDDDEEARRALTTLLRALGYATDEAANGREGLARIAAAAPDVLLLDIDMPEMNGWQVLAALRERNYAGATIVLTGADTTEDAVRALTAGADDFLAKPCEQRELVARVNAVLRRVRKPRARESVLQLGDVRIDFAARKAEIRGAPLALTRMEFRLIEELAAEPGRSLTREELLQKVWRYSPGASSRTVDTYIWRLRHKICPTRSRPQCIVTTPDGYRLATPDALVAAPDLRAVAPRPVPDE
ncbi:MAG: response regulator transcription factor [Opitutae bacterium]|nr:response regulator transcription factor [Opitutae bacterium]